MKLLEVIKPLENYKKGTYINCIYAKPLENGVIKESEMIVRLGIENKHRQVYINTHIERDTHTTDKSINWKVIKDKIIYKTSKSTILRAYATNQKRHKAKVKYYQNGIEISEEKAMSLQSKEIKKSTNTSGIFALTLENIVKLGK